MGAVCDGQYEESLGNSYSFLHLAMIHETLGVTRKLEGTVLVADGFGYLQSGKHQNLVQRSSKIYSPLWGCPPYLFHHNPHRLNYGDDPSMIRYLLNTRSRRTQFAAKEVARNEN
jgi:hypothetical protein